MPCVHLTCSSSAPSTCISVIDTTVPSAILRSSVRPHLAHTIGRLPPPPNPGPHHPHCPQGANATQALGSRGAPSVVSSFPFFPPSLVFSVTVYTSPHMRRILLPSMFLVVIAAYAKSLTAPERCPPCATHLNPHSRFLFQRRG